MTSHRILLLGLTFGAIAAPVLSIDASNSKPMPSVTVRTADGTEVSLAAYKGKIVLIDFWASWCPPCKTSFPALDTIWREYEEKGLEVLAVNVDERRRDANSFLEAHPHHLTVLFDPTGVAPEAFGVKAMPSSFLIDRSGTIRFSHMGYNGNVDERYRREIAQLLSER